MNHPMTVPHGRLASSPTNSSEEQAARNRKRVRDLLAAGRPVVVNNNGEIQDKNTPSSRPSIEVPPGKLAASFYWYERDTELLQAEVTAMQRYFPQFELKKLQDGRLAWHGVLTNQMRPNAAWELLAIYDHNHPHNNSYGGSIKVFSVQPDLSVVVERLGHIPHLLRDSQGDVYLCTARQEDFRASANHWTSAASSLSWASKWIHVFELWLAGDVTTEQFENHTF